MQLSNFSNAKELKLKDQVGIDEYLCTTISDPWQYLAPEVLYGQAYGFSSDTFSFAIFLWQLMSLRDPYECKSGSNIKLPHLTIILADLRPNINRNWNRHLQTLLRACWDKKASYRLNFPTICSKLDVFLGARKH